MEKAFFIESNTSGISTISMNILNNLLSTGWKVKSISPQRVNSSGKSMYGGFLVILKNQNKDND